ncbi:MAG: hypothetical protein U5N86_11700 [Planctomycetota bacterium]|nr:hypothetical protein [Planctomycetota bacterium]
MGKVTENSALAVKALDSESPRPDAETNIQAVLRRLNSMIEALETQVGMSEDGGSGAGGGGGSGSTIPLEQLIALRAEQADIAELTLEARENGDAEALKEIARRQHECRKLLLQLLGGNQ